MPGRHRRPSRARIAVLSAATGVTAAGAAAVMTAAPANASGDPFAAIRQCESGGNYSINTGNGFYGAYQFTQQTWSGLGYPGRPDQAPPAMQDQAARQLAAQSGFGQWPVCGAGQGSYTGGYTTYSAPAPTYSAPQRVVASAPAAPAAPVIPPSTGPWPTTQFTGALAHQHRYDVQNWQRQMRKLGFKITTDGVYGQQSQNAARFYQATHHMQQDGVVGPQTWLKTILAKKI